MPTTTEWLGTDTGKWRLDGYSLLNSIPFHRVLLVEATSYGYEKKALIRGTYKLLYSKGDKVSWVFDLLHDPYETRPLTTNDIVSVMMTELKRFIASNLLRPGMKMFKRKKI